MRYSTLRYVDHLFVSSMFVNTSGKIVDNIQYFVMKV